MPNEEQTSFYKELFAKHFTGFKEVKPGLGYGKQPEGEKKWRKAARQRKPRQGKQ